MCGDFWAVPALIVIIKRAIDQEGSLSDVLERLTNRSAGAGAGAPELRPARAEAAERP